MSHVKSIRKIKIDGVEYMKNTTNGKLYTIPRTVVTRKILRNRLRMLLKQNGLTKVNRLMKSYWKNPEIQQKIRKMA